MGQRRKDTFLTIHFLISTYHEASIMFTICSFSSCFLFNMNLSSFTWSFLGRLTTSQQPLCCNILTPLFIALFYATLSSPLKASLMNSSSSVDASDFALILNQLGFFCVRMDLRSGFSPVLVRFLLGGPLLVNCYDWRLHYRCCLSSRQLSLPRKSFTTLSRLFHS